MSQPSAEALPAGQLPVTIRPLSGLKPVHDDIFAVASVDCPMLGVEGAYMLFAPRQNRVALAAGCGCSVSVEVSRLILDLSEMLRKAGHGGAGGGTAH